mmetsp:Transcript_29436/g.62032  ORF Transcript_29436/g.62032 Transcript_29436/m.62032 type:complete len:411 (-) Transcript_29436:21-1253(-)
MSRRPRLVQEGSPIINDGDFGSGLAAAQWRGDGAPREENARQAQAVNNLASIASESSAKSKPYKLQTTLVVGEDDDDDDDMMMMDEDEHDMHNAQGNKGGYGINGHSHHGQHQQNSTGNTPFPAGYDHPANQFYNNDHSNFGPATNPVHHAPAPTPPPIYQMPPPSTSPLVVLDAANIAYNYAESLNPCQQHSQRRQPDPRGIRLAIEYFLQHSCRVQAVVPTSWYQLKPRPADHYHLQNRSRGDSDAKMITDEVEELRSLRQQGFLVACPPGDDDDAYALALARREGDRLATHHGGSMRQLHGETMEMDDGMASSLNQLPKSVLGGYVVSNDFYSDAIRRDEKKHCHYPLNARPLSLKSWLKEHRISYSFANVGTADVDGEIRLEFLPNPRNNLIEAIDAHQRIHQGMR